MTDKFLVPSIENRLTALIELCRRAKHAGEEAGRDRINPAVTISREFGSEAYPAAEKLKTILEDKTDLPWTIIDKTLIDEVASHHDLAADILHNLGQRPRWLDDMISTLSPGWKNERDHFQLLARQIVAMAARGNMIIVGMGGAIITQSMKNCHHFRIFASQEFKTDSICNRTGMSKAEAIELIEKRQKAREKFVRDFLDKDINHPAYYHLLFNNDHISAENIAALIGHHISTLPR